jgi:hypothetical protein
MTTVGIKERRTPEIAKPTPIPPFAKQVLSKDGTAIAFDRIGAGPPVILIDGALINPLTPVQDPPLTHFGKLTRSSRF